MSAPATELDLRLDLGLQHAVLPLTVPGFLKAVTARFGPRVALRFEGHDLRYDELAREARALAGALLSAGVERGDRVAILVSNRPEWATAFFGAALVGAIVVPVNTFATPEEREYILRHADARLLLMQRHLAGRDFVAELLTRHPELEEDSDAARRLSALPELHRIVCISSEPLPAAIEPWGDFLTAEPSEAWATRVDERADALTPEDPSLLIYTSGTTDLPKGVLHSQKAAVIQSWRFAEILDLHEDDIVLTAQPFFWTAGISMSLGATLAAGAKLLLQETFDAEAALDCAERERATTVHAWVHQEKAMAEHPSARGRDFGPLHRVEFDSPLAPLAGLERDVWGIHASYGMTETFTLVSALPTWASAEDRTGNSGVALPGMEIRIVHPETGEACPVGERGEIIVRGVTLMQGYWKVPAQDVFDGEGFFHTSDGGYLDSEGRLHWEGRLSGIIKTGGANVSPLEVEKAAADQPAVRAAIAVGVPHPTLGEAIVLCLVPTAGHRVDEASLRATLKRRLAAYKVPKHLVVVSESEAPTTGTQKLRADALRELAQERLIAGRVEIAGHVYGE
jgi:acyl-CoA synthetase (AMP-forming)/AMP-acid ligase II